MNDTIKYISNRDTPTHHGWTEVDRRGIECEQRFLALAMHQLLGEVICEVEEGGSVGKCRCRY